MVEGRISCVESEWIRVHGNLGGNLDCNHHIHSYLGNGNNITDGGFTSTDDTTTTTAPLE